MAELSCPKCDSGVREGGVLWGDIKATIYACIKCDWVGMAPRIHALRFEVEVIAAWGRYRELLPAGHAVEWAPLSSDTKKAFRAAVLPIIERADAAERRANEHAQERDTERGAAKRLSETLDAALRRVSDVERAHAIAISAAKEEKVSFDRVTHDLIVERDNARARLKLAEEAMHRAESDRNVLLEAIAGLARNAGFQVHR